MNSRRLVASSFRDDKGKIVRISFKNGKSQKLQITRVSANTVYAKGITEGRFSVTDISEREYFRRLGSGESAGLDIMRGVLSYNAGLQAAAQKYFSKAGCSLSDIIAEKTKDLAVKRDSVKKKVLVNIFEQSAEEDYGRLLKLLRLEHTKNNPEQTITALGSEKYGKLTLQRLSRMLARYNYEYKNAKFTLSHSDVLKALEALDTDK